MKLTEGKIKEAQEVVKAVMDECKITSIHVRDSREIRERFVLWLTDGDITYGDDLATLYINRLHELNGTQAPPF